MSQRFDDAERLRYARQIALTEWGIPGQERLRQSRVLIIGLGGLGSPIATYLAGAGVGHLTLNDFDHVDASNLPRQPLHDESNIGQPKTTSAAQRIGALNSTLEVSTIDQRLSSAALIEQCARHDLIIDASDNFGTRFGVNAAAVASATPLVSAAAIRFEGQVAVFRADLTERPCYACLYCEDDQVDEDCTGQGVMTPLVGLIGSLAANEALKLLLAWPAPEHTWLHCFDAKETRWQRIRVPRDRACPVCAKV